MQFWELIQTLSTIVWVSYYYLSGPFPSELASGLFHVMWYQHPRSFCDSYVVVSWWLWNLRAALTRRLFQIVRYKQDKTAGGILTR
jgi:hypothetical protein